METEPAHPRRPALGWLLAAGGGRRGRVAGGGHVPRFSGILMPVFAEHAWPDLHDQTVKGALVLLPPPPAIPPSPPHLVDAGELLAARA